MTNYPLKPITVMVDIHDDYPLSLSEVKYTFETLLTISGFPWRFVKPDFNSPCDIYFGYRHAQVKQATLKIKTNLDRHRAKPMAVSKENLVSNNPLTFLYFGNGDDKTTPYAIEDGGKIIVLNNDIIFSSFFLLAGLEERFIRRDSKDRHKIQDSFFHQNDLLHTPIVNQYGLFFRSFFSANYSWLPMWPQSKLYAVALSHDVDYPEMITSIETVRYIVSKKSQAKLSVIQNILSGKQYHRQS